ncbi:MAG: hypothetical protein RIS29_3356, partial [Bacteroidota bacterium]
YGHSFPTRRSSDLHFGCITETWLDECVPTESINISGYVCYRHDREDGRRGGGVLCYVREGVSCTVLHHLRDPDMESLWLLYRSTRMPRQLSHIVIGIIYHAPNADGRRTISHILNCLDSISREHPYAGFILLGDFNRLNDSSILSYPLRQIVTCATRKLNTLDKIYTNISQWYETPASIPPVGGSDHNCILLLSSDRCRKHIDRADYFTTVRSNDPNDKALLLQTLRSFNWSHMYRMNTCEDMLDYFNFVISSIIDEFLPFRVCKRNRSDKPWIDDNFRYLIRRRQFAWSNNNLVEYRMYRNKVQRCARNLRNKYYQRHINNLRNSNPKQWWQNIKKLTGQKETTPKYCIAMADELCNGNVQQLTNNINDFLQSVSDDLAPLSPDLIPPISHCPDEFIIEPYTVERRLSKINSNKSGGPDDIPNWFLRDSSVWLAEPVCAIFNASVRDGIVPTIWKKANVVPVPKTNPPRKIESDLRPISLTSTLSKVLESIVGGWILEFVRDKLDTQQYGGIRGRSTTHALVDMLHHWHQALDNSESVRIIFIDYAKAFDHVDHSNFVRKLYAYNVPQFLIRWLCSFLTNRMQRVKLSEYFSEWLTLKGSMPQGTWLGPLVFILLINDLRSDCGIHKFVDDVTLSEIIKHDLSNMSNHLNNIVEWSNQNLMNINFAKTKEMLLGRSNTNPFSSISVNSNAIERVSTFRLLGVHIDDNLKWTSHTSYIYSKASSRLYFMKLLKRSGASIDDMVHFFKTIVRSLLEYACPVWHNSLTIEQSDQIESIQKRALKIICGSNNFDYEQLLALYNLSSLVERRETLCKRFFEKSVLSSSSCLHYLLPPYRDPNIIAKLRHANLFATPTARTERFRKSFLMYALDNY